MLRDLKDWFARKPIAQAAGQQYITHSADVRMLLWAVIGVEVVTAVVIDLMIPPAFRIPHVLWEAAVLTFCLGLCAMTARTPHLVDDQVLRIRTGPFRELTVPLESVASLHVRHGAVAGRGLRRVPDDEEAVACSTSSATALVLDLAEALPVALRRGETVAARRVHFSADAPAAAIELIKRATTGSR